MPKSHRAQTPFERVFALVRRVPRRKVVTFGQLSELTGGALSALGVSWAISAARRADRDDVPWQRVVNADGSLATAKDGGRAQRALLVAEGIRVDRDGCVDLERNGWTPRAPK